MSKTIINIKTDAKTKRELKQFAAELGMPMTAIINAQIKQMLRSRTVTLTTDLKPTPYLEKILLDVEEDLKTGKNITRTNSLEEALAHLDSL
ncbi:MAG: hypothetical protein AAB896_02335 [Patescibacteria group bacterium]